MPARALLAALTLGAALLLAVRPVRADETAPPADRWRFGIGLAAAWSQTWADADSSATAQVPDPLGGGCLCTVTGVGSGSGSVTPNGFGLEPSARVWLPVSLLGGQPWLEAGYRQPFSSTRNDELRVPNDRTMGGFAAIFSLRPKRTATVRLGMDWSLPMPKLPILVAPVLGADFSWFQSRLDYLAFGPPGLDDSQTDFFAGITGGLEARVPLHRGPGHSLELGVMGTYTGYLGHERSLDAAQLAPLFPAYQGASASYDLDGAFAVRVGLLASFW